MIPNHVDREAARRRAFWKNMAISLGCALSIFFSGLYFVGAGVGFLEAAAIVAVIVLVQFVFGDHK